MTNVATDEADHLTGLEPIHLDPFGWHIGVASRIPGLGGQNIAHDPTYVFHTPYVKVARGSAAFEIEFLNLAARRGTLLLRVHMLPDEPGATARMIDSERIQLNRLMQHGARARLSFQAFHGVTYALMGLIPDDSDVTADDLFIRLDQGAGRVDTKPISYGDGRNTRFGSNAVAPTAHMLAMDAPSLATPMSQPFTAAQQDEAEYHRWLERLDMEAQPGAEQWERIFLLQALESYGMLNPGATGLGIVARSDTALRDMVKMGVEATIVRPGARACPIELEHYPGVEINDLPDSLVDFDFLWSQHAFGAETSTKSTIQAIDSMMERLRPGGLAVHIFTAGVPTSSTTPRDEAIFSRHEIERFALVMISRNYEVVRVRSAAIPLDRGITAFVFILRRPYALL